MKRWHGVDLEHGTFYTDNLSDLPESERWDRPRIIDSAPRLLLVARLRGYPVEKCK